MNHACRWVNMLPEVVWELWVLSTLAEESRQLPIWDSLYRLCLLSVAIHKPSSWLFPKDLKSQTLIKRFANSISIKDKWMDYFFPWTIRRRKNRALGAKTKGMTKKRTQEEEQKTQRRNNLPPICCCCPTQARGDSHLLTCPSPSHSELTQIPLVSMWNKTFRSLVIVKTQKFFQNK